MTTGLPRLVSLLHTILGDQILLCHKMILHDWRIRGGGVQDCDKKGEREEGEGKRGGEVFDSLQRSLKSIFFMFKFLVHFTKQIFSNGSKAKFFFF